MVYKVNCFLFLDEVIIPRNALSHLLHKPDKKIKGSKFYPAISGIFLFVCKLNHFYLQVHSFCKFCMFEV